MGVGFHFRKLVADHIYHSLRDFEDALVLESDHAHSMRVQIIPAFPVLVPGGI